MFVRSDGTIQHGHEQGTHAMTGMPAVDIGTHGSQSTEFQRIHDPAGGVWFPWEGTARGDGLTEWQC